jgi:hypothetical protein
MLTSKKSFSRKVSTGKKIITISYKDQERMLSLLDEYFTIDAESLQLRERISKTFDQLCTGDTSSMDTFNRIVNVAHIGSCAVLSWRIDDFRKHILGNQDEFQGLIIEAPLASCPFLKWIFICLDPLHLDTEAGDVFVWLLTQDDELAKHCVEVLPMAVETKAILEFQKLTNALRSMVAGKMKWTQEDLTIYAKSIVDLAHNENQQVFAKLLYHAVVHLARVHHVIEFNQKLITESDLSKIPVSIKKDNPWN